MKERVSMVGRGVLSGKGKGESSLARKRMGVMCKERRRPSVCFHTAAVR